MKTLCIVFLLAALTLKADSVRVAAASNTAYAMKALKHAFEAKHPDIAVETVLGSSGKLTAQIQHGAPFDIFLSANVKYPRYLYEAGKTVGKERVYARGALILFSRKARTFESGVNICSRESVKRIAIANPKLAPYGIAAHEALTKAGVIEAAAPKLIKAENINQTMQYALKQTDLGFIARSALYSDALSPYNKEGVHWIAVDPDLYSPIEQAGVLLQHAKNNAAATTFMDFLFSDEAKSIFTHYGYLIP